MTQVAAQTASTLNLGDTPAANLPAPVAASTAVAVPETSILERLGAVENEWAGLDDLDMAPDQSGIPVIKIGRKNDGTGGIKLAGDDDNTMSAAYVWAARGVSRVKFDGPFDKKLREAAHLPVEIAVICRSADGVAPLPAQDLWVKGDPVTGEKLPEPKACAACPYLYENGGDCKKSMEALVYLPEADDADTVRVARLRFSGLAYKEARLYWDSFKFRLPKKPSVAFVTAMTLEVTDTDNGKFLVPHFERASELTIEQAAVFIGDARSRIAQWHQVIAEDLMETTADDLSDVRAGKPEGPFDGEPVASSGDPGPTYQGSDEEDPF